MELKRIKERSIKPTDTILSALKKMDALGVKSLLVTDDNDLFVGMLSIGDIQRAIIRNDALQSQVVTILRPNPRVGSEDFSIEQIKDEMIKFRMEFMPVIGKSRNISKVYFWEDLFFDQSSAPVTQFNLPVVIMAGGLGTRLQPFTNVLPKPLFPSGNRTIIEDIFAKFARHGCKEFFISVNYKADILEYYLKSLNLEYKLHFIREEKPLGTAGSLYLLKQRIKGTFFISNCDIIIDQDYSEILDYHTENQNAITIVAALKHYPIPYGIVETGENGMLALLQEKPELTFKINSGMYILESSVLAEIPDKTFYHITKLIEKVFSQGGKVGVFPVSEGSWQDIGNFDNKFNLGKN